MHRYVSKYRVVGLLFTDSMSRRTRVNMIESSNVEEILAYLRGFIDTLGPGEQAFIETIES